MLAPLFRLCPTRFRRFALLMLISSNGIVCASGLLVANESTIETIAGTGSETPNAVTTPLATNIGNPFGVEYGPDGHLYICEVSNHRVWRLDANDHQLTVVAGTGEKGYSGDGNSATAARLNEPYEVRFDAQGNLFFVEMQNHVVRRVDRLTDTITTVAGTGIAGFGGDGGPATQAQLKQPHSIAFDAQGALYIADIGNHRIRRVDPTSGKIETIAGNGRQALPQVGHSAFDRPVSGPRALFITGQTLWVALREGHSVWRLPLDHGHWQHVAGTGQRGYDGDGQPAQTATLNGPKGITIDQTGNVYVVDTENQVIRRIDAATQHITTLAGSGPDQRGFDGDGGAAVQAKLNRPHGIGISPDGHHIVIGDSENHRVRKIIVQP